MHISRSAYPRRASKSHTLLLCSEVGYNLNADLVHRRIGGQHTKFKKTGAIWDRSEREIARIVMEVCSMLRERYGISRLGNPEDPLEDLVYIILSNKTSPATAQLVYSQLKEVFHDWDAVVTQPKAVLYSTLRPAGLAAIKSEQIRGTLMRVREERGVYDIGHLRGKSDEETESFLTSLPGVSEKVAKCVQMYTLGSEVLPVDAHVHRVATRLGWTARKRADQSHAELEALVPPDSRYAFHVDCILHGREVCRPRMPNCNNCCIKTYCRYLVS